jgi:hypothetical protein
LNSFLRYNQHNDMFLDKIIYSTTLSMFYAFEKMQNNTFELYSSVIELYL